MGIISTKPTFVAGTYIVASAMNSEFSDVIDDLNDLDVREGLLLLLSGTRAMTGDLNMSTYSVKCSSIIERAAGVGVTVDTCLIKDGFAKSRIVDISDIPGAIAAILTDHDKLAHDALALDHGALTGLGDDDHTQYLLQDGTRAMAGDLNMGTYKLKTTNLLLKEENIEMFTIRNLADDAYRGLRVNVLNAYTRVSTDEITERTGDHGVDVDGCLIKDGIAEHADEIKSSNLLFRETLANPDYFEIVDRVTPATRKNLLIDLAIAYYAFSTDTILERTSGSGVNVDSCLIKDGKAANSDKVDGCDAGVATGNVFKIPAGIAQGDIFYADAAPNLVKLAAGTSGHFLKTQGAAANPIWAAGAAGGGDACLVVAANDTPATLKDRADYVCDGVSDEVQINAALAAADTVILCPGTFITDADISMSSNQSLFGSGFASIIKIKDGNSAYFKTIKNADPIGGNANILIANLKVDGNRPNVTGSKYDIYFDNVTEGIITNCFLYNAKTDAALIVNSEHCQLSNLLCVDNWYGPSFGGGLDIGSDFITVNNCIIRNSQTIGIFMEGCSNCSIKNNTIFKSSLYTDNNYSDIALFGSDTQSSDYNDIQNNTIRAPASGNLSQYAIKVGASYCNHNLIANNDCFGAGKTATFLDSGTNTNWGAGNRKKDGTWAVGV